MKNQTKYIIFFMLDFVIILGIGIYFYTHKNIDNSLQNVSKNVVRYDYRDIIKYIENNKENLDANEVIIMYKGCNSKKKLCDNIGEFLGKYDKNIDKNVKKYLDSGIKSTYIESGLYKKLEEYKMNKGEILDNLKKKIRYVYKAGLKPKPMQLDNGEKMYGYSPIVFYMNNGYFDEAKYLINTYNIDVKQKLIKKPNWGWLVGITDNGTDFKMFKFLYDEGINVNAIDKFSEMNLFDKVYTVKDSSKGYNKIYMFLKEKGYKHTPEIQKIINESNK